MADWRWRLPGGRLLRASQRRVLRSEGSFQQPSAGLNSRGP
ncbi:hypothetical protein ACFFX0_21350 [Citricoccus parietis]|uniref:Uncharacterized protein n=1 Tax=Citricoccus parietis TaxID=592307 RepID=A0ABV5G3U7_9MICC